MLEKMTIKEFIINFFYATHIYENYSEYEVWENNPYLNEFEEYPDFIDYLDNKTSRDIECMVYIINSFENGRYKVKTASFDKDLQEDDYDEFDYYIKNVRETFDEDDKESEFYERELKLHEKFEFEIEYYDYEYDIYYAEDKYKELFNNFLKKHDLLGKYSSSENLEITKEEFIAQNSAFIAALDEDLKAAVAWSKANPEKTAELAAKYLPFPQEALAAGIPHSRFSAIPAASIEAEILHFYTEMHALNAKITGGRVPDAGLFYRA